MYYLYWILFTCFEIILFLLPAFPPKLWMRLFVLFIYVISHFLGVQTKYKSFKKSVLHPEEEKSVTPPSYINE